MTKHAKFIHFAIAAVFCALAVVAAAAQADQQLRDKLQSQLNEWHKNGKFPGATFAAVLPDGRPIALAAGNSDRELKTPMKPSDRMLSGSVGKTYAAALSMQLISEGYFNLDDKIGKYLGKEKWFSRLPNSADITVRQLMNHTSGLVRYEFKEQFTKDLTADPGRVWKPAELIAYVLDTKAPFAAGQDWDYSDTNYIVLGMIMEKVTGKKYYEMVQERILKPLKLKNTVPSDRRSIRGLVQGYAGPDNPFGGKDAVIESGKFIINPQFEWTGGGMASTTEDLAVWARELYEGRAFSQTRLPEIFEGVAAPMLGRETKYGLGVILRQTALGASRGHSGFMPGYMTDMMYFPDHKLAVAIQVNTSVPKDLGKPLGRILVELAETIAAAEKAPKK